jgi:hypothetical protein
MTAAYGSNDSLGAFVRQMAVDHQKGMQHAGDPEQHRQKDIQNALNRLAAQQNGEGVEGQSQENIASSRPQHTGLPVISGSGERVVRE